MKSHEIKYRVYYEDTDAGGVVYYGSYLKFAERARTDFLRLSGVNQYNLAKETGLFFVVRNVSIEYLFPGRLDDEISVLTSVTKVGKTSVSLNQVFSNQIGVTLANMKTQIVCVQNIDANKIKSAAMPEIVKKFFSEG